MDPLVTPSTSRPRRKRQAKRSTEAAGTAEEPARGAAHRAGEEKAFVSSAPTGGKSGLSAGDVERMASALWRTLRSLLVLLLALRA